MNESLKPIKGSLGSFKEYSKSLKKLFSQLFKAYELIGENGLPQKLEDESFCSSIFNDIYLSSYFGS